MRILELENRCTGNRTVNFNPPSPFNSGTLYNNFNQIADQRQSDCYALGRAVAESAEANAVSPSAWE